MNILLVRPFIAAIFPSKAKMFKTRFLVNSNHVLQANQIREAFTGQFSHFVGSFLHYSDYRHFAAYISYEVLGSKLATALEDEDEDEKETFVHRQFGHSVSTAAQRYGRGHADFGPIRGWETTQYIKVSLEWHQFLLGRKLSSDSSHLIQPSSNSATPSQNIPYSPIIRNSDLANLGNEDFRSTIIDKGHFSVNRFVDKRLTPIALSTLRLIYGADAAFKDAVLQLRTFY